MSPEAPARSPGGLALAVVQARAGLLADRGAGGADTSQAGCPHPGREPRPDEESPADSQARGLPFGAEGEVCAALGVRAGSTGRRVSS